jgi:hypothetical protein
MLRPAPRPHARLIGSASSLSAPLPPPGTFFCFLLLLLCSMLTDSNGKKKMDFSTLHLWQFRAEQLLEMNYLVVNYFPIQTGILIFS